MTLVALSYIAGVFSLLNPCAFPLIPIFLSSTWQRHRLGPLALILGLSLTFTIMGFALVSPMTNGLISSSHAVWGFELKTLRLISALLLLTIGIFLAYQPLQAYFLKYGKPIVLKFRHTLHPAQIEQFPLEKLGINFLIGALVGFIWIPCTGPTLSLALALASRGDHFEQAIALMSIYTLGVTTPLIGLSLLSKKYLKKKNLLKKGHTGRKWLGCSLIAICFLILTGSDKAIETWAVSHTPQWLLKLTTKY
jgi:cytochrome c biogenesis protein CcdA